MCVCVCVCVCVCMHIHTYPSTHVRVNVSCLVAKPANKGREQGAACQLAVVCEHACKGRLHLGKDQRLEALRRTRNRQKSPVYVAKEPYLHGKRGLLASIYLVILVKGFGFRVSRLEFGG